MLQADLGFIDQFIFFCQIRVGTPNSGYMDHVCPGLNGPYSINRLVRYRIRREIGLRVGFRLVPISLL